MARLRLLGIMRDWAGCDRMQVPAATLADAIQALKARGGWRLEAKAFLEDARPIAELEFLVNGHNARFLRGADTPLGPDDEVVVFVHRSWAEVPFL